MTLPFKPEALPYIKTLSGAPATIILAMLVATRPVGRNELTIVTEYGKDKIAEGLQILEALGIAQNIKRYQGWMLTQKGKQLVMPFFQEDARLEAGKSAQPTSLPLTTITTTINQDQDSEGIVIDSPIGKSAQPTSDQKPMDNLWGCHENSEAVNELTLAGTIPNRRTKNLLAFEHINADYIKAWRLQFIADGKFNGEPNTCNDWSGLFVTTLESGAQAPPLNKNGHLANCKCDDCRWRLYATDSHWLVNRDPDDQAEDECEYIEELVGVVVPSRYGNHDTKRKIKYPVHNAEPSVHEPITGSFTAATAWQAALYQLQIEMPKAPFDTWVRGAQISAYDKTTQTITVATINAYARDWLEDRLTSTIAKLLSGILAQETQINFVVEN